MLEVLTHLLVLQDRDRQILTLQSELASLAPQRETLGTKVSATQAQLEAARTRFKQLEVQRHESEQEVEANQQQIARYSMQQYQTKKNDEYRALAHEIETCKSTIRKLEDQQLELMEQAEAVQKKMAEYTQAANEISKIAQAQNAELTVREQALAKRLAELEGGRNQLAASIEDGVRARYERLLKHRGEKIVVGIDHGVCAGCHMTLPPQILISCQSDQEIVSCPNCGRILYYTRDMDLSVTADR
jgi:predicted  nucleic acid-binding Zn-ribbon protein